MSKQKYITPTEHGFVVKPHKKGRTIKSKFFGKNRYGGVRKAKQEAIKHRDTLCNKHDIPLNGTNYWGKGYCYIEATKKWRAEWGPKSNRQTKSFSVRKYGFRRAKKLAKETAEQMRKKGR